LKFLIYFRSPLARFLALYGTLYAAFGVQSPYLPSLLDSHGLPSEAIALVLAAGTAMRLVAGPAAGRLADTLDAPKAVLIVCSAAAGLIALGYLPARGLWPLLIVGVIHSAALAPFAPANPDCRSAGTGPAVAAAVLGRPLERCFPTCKSPEGAPPDLRLTSVNFYFASVN
jgi:PPP family 3-phenylpropionic acid transporter